MIQGYTDLQIRNELNISERNWNKTYRPRLNEKYKNIWLAKQEEELFHATQLAQDQLQDALNNIRKKAREPNAHSGWGALEVELDITLFDFKHRGISAINSHRLRSIQEKTGQNRVLSENKSESGQSEQSGSGSTEGSGGSNE